MVNIQVESYGKWILAGEHSVLRGYPALVFPLKSKKLTMVYGDNAVDEGKAADFSADGKSPSSFPQFLGDRGSEYEVIFRAVLEKCGELLNVHSQNLLNKQIILNSSLPVGAGLGASAAFCVAITKLLYELGHIPKSEVYSFALRLENLFHGESSGVDIAVCLRQKPLIFERSGRREIFEPTWKPFLYVSYAGQRGMTFDCVKKVKLQLENNPELGKKLDAQMGESAQICLSALQSNKPALDLLASGIAQARECFESWELTGGGVKAEMDRLLQAGAMAVKPTGSGGGGYVLSLWAREPRQQDVPGLSFCFD